MNPDPNQIQNMFSSIANRYDRANDVLSLGVHHRWRKELVRWSGVRGGERILDCATGTGDLALEFKTAVGPQGEVIGTDFCEEMLALAPKKAKERKLDLRFEVADVEKLPYPDQSFDVASIAFGIRNVSKPKVAIAELYRVVKPGGRVMVLEFGQPRMPVVRQIYRGYAGFVLPKLGGLVTGRPEAYRYLEDSSSKFPCAEDFVLLMGQSAPFREIALRRLSLGIAYLYKGTV